MDKSYGTYEISTLTTMSMMIQMMPHMMILMMMIIIIRRINTLLLVRLLMRLLLLVLGSDTTNTKQNKIINRTMYTEIQLIRTKNTIKPANNKNELS